MELKGHLLYYPEGKHDINLNNYVQKSQLNDALKSKVDSITKTTYADLRNLRDNSQLVPGSLYRITDYNCTTIQENTRSAGHQFDIVLLALSENKLAEEGWAMMHDNIYDVVCTDGVIIKCYYYEYYGEFAAELANLVNVDTLLGYSGTQGEYEGIINHETKTITFPIDSATVLSGLSQENLTYNYFQNSNLSAWKVWYCLDNDKSRFAWADNGKVQLISNKSTTLCDRLPNSDTIKNNIQYYAWFRKGTGGGADVTVYTTSENPISGDTIYQFMGGTIPTDTVKEIINTPAGTGVIYRLIDEWNNDVGYDFKNIQFLVENNWLYTMSNNGSSGDNSLDASVSNDGFVVNNYISKQINVMEGGEILGENILIHCGGCSIIGVNCRNNTVVRGDTKLINCIKTTSVNGDSILIDCGEFTPEESGFYYLNKKVLTES